MVLTSKLPHDDLIRLLDQAKMTRTKLDFQSLVIHSTKRKYPQAVTMRIAVEDKIAWAGCVAQKPPTIVVDEPDEIYWTVGLNVQVDLLEALNRLQILMV
jgi:hypothetical protein